MKTEQICRTCLIDDGNFFNISHIFDHNSIAQMIRDITDLQVDNSDGYTQAICFKCVKEVRRAHKFRRKCIETSNNLIKIEEFLPSKPFEKIAVKSELLKVEDIKQEVVENSDVFLQEENNENDNESCKLSSPASASDYDNDDDQSSDDDKIKHDGLLKEEKIEPECILETEYNTENESKESKFIILDDSKCKNKWKLIFDCPFCHGLFMNKNSFYKHLVELHPEKAEVETSSQKIAPLGFISKRKIKDNIEYSYTCNVDGFAGKSLEEFKNHMKDHFGEKPISCPSCDFKTNSVRGLKHHRIRRHTEEKNYKCSQCEYCCKSQQALDYHLARHTGERKYQCKLCLMTFKRPSDVSVHKKVKHEKRKPHVCSICQKAFFHSKDLNVHMIVHTGERRFVCDSCGLAFGQRAQLSAHIISKHLPKSDIILKCEHCKYTTPNKYRLTTHVKEHFAEKKFKCTLCEYKSHRSSSLQDHMLIHFDAEKKFKCDICDYRCLTQTRLKTHKKLHSGERLFPCNICSYSGKSKQALRRHLLTHNTELKFICHNCPYRTTTKELLQKHWRKNCIVKIRGRPPTIKLELSQNKSTDTLQEESITT